MVEDETSATDVAVSIKASLYYTKADIVSFQLEKAMEDLLQEQTKTQSKQQAKQRLKEERKKMIAQRKAQRAQAMVYHPHGTTRTSSGTKKQAPLGDFLRASAATTTTAAAATTTACTVMDSQDMVQASSAMERLVDSREAMSVF